MGPPRDRLPIFLQKAKKPNPRPNQTFKDLEPTHSQLNRTFDSPASQNLSRQVRPRPSITHVTIGDGPVDLIVGADEGVLGL